MKFANVVFPETLGFDCKKCGVCCKMQPPDVDKAEQKRIESRAFRDFLELADQTGIRWIKRKKDGSCFFLTINNECAIYDVRPAICRLEPFTIMDYDYEKNRIELELNFPFSACCVGTSADQKSSVKEIAKAAQILVQRIIALTAKDLDLPATDKRVFVETRSRLLRRSIEMADLKL